MGPAEVSRSLSFKSASSVCQLDCGAAHAVPGQPWAAGWRCEKLSARAPGTASPCGADIVLRREVLLQRQKRLSQKALFCDGHHVF
jgi:hypothetical protein